MKLRVAPLYNKMWRQASSLDSRLISIGVLVGTDERWARWATRPHFRRIDIYPLGIGYLPARPAIHLPRGVPTFIQPRGEP